MSKLLDSTGFALNLTAAEIDNTITEKLNRTRLEVKADKTGRTYLVHRDGAYVPVSFAETKTRLGVGSTTAVVDSNSLSAEDDFIRAFRFMWSIR